MRLVFMGTPDFAAVVCETLLQSEEEVCAVVTQPDKPVGRKAELRPSPVKVCAEDAGIPVLQPQRLREEGCYQALADLQPDAIIVAAFGQLVPKAILDLPRFGCLNIHASLLPKYRGAAPIQWALLNGEEKTGVTIMQMNEGLDTGDILAVREIPITPQETGGSLFDRLARAGAELLLETLPVVEAGNLTPIPQPKESPTAYARMLQREDGRLDWQKPATVLERQIRALYPWPAAYTRWGEKTLKIWGASLPGQETNTSSYDRIQVKEAPGTILPGPDFAVQTGDGILILTDVQEAGKKRMSAEAYRRGHAPGAGEKFT